MQQKIDRIRNTIYLAMLSLFCFLIFAYLNDIFYKSRDSWLLCAILTVFAVVADYFSRKYLYNVLFFFGAHILTAGICFIVPRNIADQIIMLCIGGALFILSIGFWKMELQERSKIVIDIPLSAIAMFIIVYIHSSFYFSNALTTYAYLGGIAFFLLYYIRVYLDKFSVYTAGGKQFTTEINNTFSVNFFMVLFFDVVAVGVVLTVNTFFSDSKFNVIGRLFRAIARFFFSFIPRSSETQVQAPIASVADVASNTETVTVTSTETTTTVTGSPAAQAVTNILQIVLAIAMVLLIIFIIYKFIKTYLHKNLKTGDKVSKLSKEDISRVKSDRVKEEDEFKLPTFGSNRIKIRKIFIHRVNTFKKYNPRIILNKSLTPFEITDKITSVDSYDSTRLNSLTELYERARYSNREITKQDLQDAKNLSK